MSGASPKLTGRPRRFTSPTTIALDKLKVGESLSFELDTIRVSNAPPGVYTKLQSSRAVLRKGYGKEFTIKRDLRRNHRKAPPCRVYRIK